MEEISVKQVVRTLYKRLWLILVVPIVVALIVGVYFYYQPNVYTAKTALVVAVTYQDSTGQLRVDTSAGTSFASDYKALFERSPVIENAAAELHLENLGSIVKLDVVNVPNTRIVEVHATGENRFVCADVANTTSRFFKTYIQDFMRVDSVSISKEAEVPTTPSGPARTRNTMLAFVLSMVACVGIILMLEMLNTKVKDESQVREMLDIPVLGNVIGYRKEMTSYMEEEGPQVNHLLSYVSDATRESVKTTAANIMFSSLDHPLRSLVLTSTTPSEGKSTLSVMLASLYAEEGKRTLLVDMDFRNPTLGRLLKRRNRHDIIDCLSGNKQLQDVITPTGVENLYFIDNSHQATMLSRVVMSDSFSQFMQQAQSMFDLIIFDTPPLGMFVDAALLASKVDGAILTVARNVVELDDVRGVLDQLEKSNATTLGAIINFVQPVKGHGYYDKRYGRYYEQQNGKKRKGRKDKQTGQTPQDDM